MLLFFFFSSRRRHTRFDCDWSSDVCSSDLGKWRSNAQIEAAKAKAKAEAEKKAQKASEEPVNSGPPRLKRPGDASPQGSSPSQPATKNTPPPAPTGAGSAS